MSTQPQPKVTVESVTVCKLCQHGIALTGLSIPIVGEEPAMRAARYVTALEDHIKRRHPRESAAITAMQTWMRDILVIGSYRTEDPVLLAGYELARAHVHAATRKNRLSDDNLVEGLAQAGFTSEEIDRIKPIAQYMRDFLSEQGSFAHPKVQN
jgi:hypothetical protein